MRNFSALLCGLALLGASVGCSSFERSAYQTVGVTTTAVDLAMNGWGSYVKSGHATQAEEAKVKAAYIKYQDAIVVLRDAVESWIASGRPSSGTALIQAAIDVVVATEADVVKLIGDFQANKTSELRSRSREEIMAAFLGPEVIHDNR